MSGEWDQGCLRDGGGTGRCPKPSGGTENNHRCCCVLRTCDVKTVSGPQHVITGFSWLTVRPQRGCSRLFPTFLFLLNMEEEVPFFLKDQLNELGWVGSGGGLRGPCPCPSGYSEETGGSPGLLAKGLTHFWGGSPKQR